jgi:hypothetical protein
VVSLSNHNGGDLMDDAAISPDKPIFSVGTVIDRPRKAGVGFYNKLLTNVIADAKI